MVYKTELLAILEEERRRHPRMVDCDVQKFMVQAALGGDHMLRDRDHLEASLTCEWEGLPAVPPDAAVPGLQIIDPEERTARLHLAPCKAGGVSIESLVEMLWSQPRKCGTRERFEAFWQEVLHLARQGRIRFDAASLEAAGFREALPHHSSCYGPVAYRIVNDVTDPQTRARLEPWGFLR